MGIQGVLVLFLLSLCLSTALTPLFRRLAMSFEIWDLPNQKHKTHKEPIPYLGGVSISMAFLICISLFELIKPNTDQNSHYLLILTLVPILLMILGLVDDIKGLGAFTRLSVQSLLGIIVGLFLIEINRFGNLGHNTVLILSLSTLWIVGITNAFNLMDNIDGAACGVAVISSTALAIGFLRENLFPLAITSVLIVGVGIGFLFWNFPQARIYLGDAGSLFLGSILSILAISLDPTTPNFYFDWFFAITIFAIPILDTVVVVISRVSSGKSPIQGGRDHLSHRLLNRGVSKKITVLLIWIAQIYFSVLGLSLLWVDLREAFLIQGLAISSAFILGIYFLNLKPIKAQH